MIFLARSIDTKLIPCYIKCFTSLMEPFISHDFLIYCFFIRYLLFKTKYEPVRLSQL